MPDLPPIGSLWLHRDSGERRVMFGESFSSFGDFVSYVEPDDIHTVYEVPLADWLSWQANAIRIDKEQA